MVPISNASRLMLRVRFLSQCSFRRHASSSTSSAASSAKRATAIPRPPKPSTQALPQRPTGQFSRGLPPDLLRKQYYAEKLYNSGQRAIYRPPSQAGIFTTAYLYSAGCVLIAGYLAFSNTWIYDPNSDLPWFVSSAWRLGIIVFTVIGGVIFFRSTRFVKAIDLVSMNGQVKMAVQVRRPLAFLRPKEYIIAPYDLRMQRSFVQQLEDPFFVPEPEQSTGLASEPKRQGLGIGRSISQGIFYVFSSARRLMTLEGIMNVKFEGSSGDLRLDTQGLFSNGARDLVEMGIIED